MQKSCSMPLQTVDLMNSAASSEGDNTDTFFRISIFSHFLSRPLVCGFAVLAVGGVTFIAVACKWKRVKPVFKKTIASLQNELQNKEKELRHVRYDMSEVSTIIKDLKTYLEQQRDQLRGELEEVEAEKEENKKKLQSVETEITEKEKTFEKPEELLKEKENQLQAQWKLDEKKKNCEKQKIHIEKLLEPLELKVSRMNRRRDVQIWFD